MILTRGTCLSEFMAFVIILQFTMIIHYTGDVLCFGIVQCLQLSQAVGCLGSC